jgi:peroxiredoxin
MKHLSVGMDIRSTLIKGVFTVHGETDEVGLRNPGQVNESGIPVIDLDQVGRTDAVEHDVSLTREDRALGDYMKPDPDLVDKFIRYPGNKASFSIPDLGRFRQLRYAEQKEKNPELKFDSENNKVAVFEAAFLQATFGLGAFYTLPVQYVKAMFQEERLPYKEGWRSRWIPVIFPELLILQRVISHYASPT